MLDGVITENIGNLAEQEKWNEISVSSVERIGRALSQRHRQRGKGREGRGEGGRGAVGIRGSASRASCSNRGRGWSTRVQNFPQ